MSLELQAGGKPANRRQIPGFVPVTGPVLSRLSRLCPGFVPGLSRLCQADQQARTETYEETARNIRACCCILEFREFRV